MTPETYTRDSDDEWETIPPNRIDYQQPGYEYRYQKRRKIPEPEPMPELRLGDYITHIDSDGTWREGIVFALKRKSVNFANSGQLFVDFLIDGIRTVRRVGQELWEAKK